MDCIAMKAFIAADSQLAQVHFLLKTKARRGENHAVVYHAGRFFDLHEEMTLASLAVTRSDTLESAFSRSLVRLGFIILTAGFGAAVKSAIALCALPFVCYLLRSEFRIISRARVHDRSLKEYIAMLCETRNERREAFVREVVEHAAVIGACGKA